jgi:putative transposase
MRRECEGVGRLAFSLSYTLIILTYHTNSARIKSMKEDRQLTFNDYRMTTGEHGGPRPGAGRPMGDGSEVSHLKRPKFSEAEPAHVTMRIRKGFPSLRTKRFIRAFRHSLRQVRLRDDFRVVEYSLQSNHVHMIIEATGNDAMASGMKAVASRLARAANCVFGRKGKVLDGRYRLRALKTPREVRNALAYVLLNIRKHYRERKGHAPPVHIDEASSARWFEGWLRNAPTDSLSPDLREVSPAHSWLLTKGWKQWGLIDPTEIPGASKQRTA